MVCIYCSKKTRVINSRLQKRINGVWRRRECTECGSIFTTLEAVDGNRAVVVKNQSAVLPFSRDKLFISVYESCRHRKSAISDASALTDTIAARALAASSNATLAEQTLKDTAHKTLKRFDLVAAVHYKAYYYGK